MSNSLTKVDTLKKVLSRYYLIRSVTCLNTSSLSPTRKSLNASYHAPSTCPSATGIWTWFVVSTSRSSAKPKSDGFFVPSNMLIRRRPADCLVVLKTKSLVASTYANRIAAINGRPGTASLKPSVSVETKSNTLVDANSMSDTGEGKKMHRLNHGL